jgi:hypothetical protein
MYENNWSGLSLKVVSLDFQKVINNYRSNFNEMLRNDIE